MIDPCRRLSPGGALGGNQADEAHELLGALEPGEVSGLSDQPDRCQRVDPAHATQPGDQLMVGPSTARRSSSNSSPSMRRSTWSTANRIVKGLLLAGQLESLAPEPRTTRDAPARCRHRPLVAQAELPEPVTRTHPVQPRVLTRPDEITQRLMLGRRDEDLRQEPRRVKPRKPPSVTLIGLDSVSRARGHQSRSDDHAVHPSGDQCAVQPKASRAGLLADPGARPRPELTQRCSWS